MLMYANIKFFVMDVDGTLTDGKIYMGNDGEMMKAFDIKDGCGIHDILIPSGIIPVIITGRSSLILKRRCDELGIKELYQGVEDKLAKLHEILYRYQSNNNCIYKLSNVAYIGDDMNDLSIMQEIKARNGIVGCPSDAIAEVKAIADFVSDRMGGNGAVRDFIECIMRGCE